jgi:hypothetical protein
MIQCCQLPVSLTPTHPHLKGKLPLQMSDHFIVDIFNPNGAAAINQQQRRQQ